MEDVARVFIFGIVYFARFTGNVDVDVLHAHFVEELEKTQALGRSHVEEIQRNEIYELALCLVVF